MQSNVSQGERIYWDFFNEKRTKKYEQKTRACHSFSGKEHLEVLPLSPEGDAIVSQGPIHTPHVREERQSGAEFHI